MDNLFKTVYRGKKVLVTGDTGFKGAWLSLWLTELGANVIGYALEPPTKPSLFEASNLEKRIIHVVGDIRDEERLKQVFKKQQPDIVFHSAAQSLVRLSYKEPKLTYETNVIGTLNLFEAVRKTQSVKVVVNVTSDKCYDNKEWVFGYRENDSMGGYDPYSSSKGCTELLTSAYRNSYLNPINYGKTHNVALASVRAGNVIGGGDWAEDRLIPDCVKALTKNQVIIIRNPRAIRPWQYVLEPLSGYLWLGALMWQDGISYSQGWNFGPGDDAVLSVEQIVKKAIKFWGAGEYNIDQNMQFHEAKLLKLDISKVYFSLKWKPVYKADKALEETISWYKEFYKGKNNNIYKLSLNQINNYVNNAKRMNLEWTISQGC